MLGTQCRDGQATHPSCLEIRGRMLAARRTHLMSMSRPALETRPDVVLASKYAVCQKTCA